MLIGFQIVLVLVLGHNLKAVMYNFLGNRFTPSTYIMTEGGEVLGIIYNITQKIQKPITIKTYCLKLYNVELHTYIHHGNGKPIK